jgi:methionyl aminopeptidase
MSNIKPKTPSQIKKMIKVGEILAEVKKEILNFVRPGITTLELDKIAHNYMIKQNVTPSFLGYYGFPNVICASVNEILIHGIPNNIPLNDGDLLSIDVGIILDGYHADSAFSVSVGTETPENKKLIAIAKEAFYAGMNAIKPGARTGDIGAAIQKVIKKHNVFVPLNFAGHGIGENMHEDPLVFNYGTPKTGQLLKNNMTICIEPMIIQGSNKVTILKDG